MKKRNHLNGSEHDDFIFMKGDITSVTGRRGSDTFVCDTHRDVVVDGGFGRDTFEFYVPGALRVDFNEVSEEKTIIKIFDDANDHVQKIVLIDIEEINWAMVA